MFSQPIRGGLPLQPLGPSATNQNCILPTFVSLQRDPLAFAVDALSTYWRGMFAYAFPPPALLHKVVQRLNQFPCKLILITPYWPRMLWFTSLVNLAVTDPLKLPQDPDTLSQVLGSELKVFHTNPQLLNLHAWLLVSH